jgi:hypothetical protein
MNFFVNFTKISLARQALLGDLQQHLAASA